MLTDDGWNLSYTWQEQKATIIFEYPCREDGKQLPRAIVFTNRTR